LITVSLRDPAFKDKPDVIKTELMNTGVVSSLARSSSPMTQIWNITTGYNWQGKDPNLDGEFVVCNVTPDFGKTVAWKISAGRDFSSELPTDTTEAVIINEAAAKYMGFKNPVGEKLEDLDEFGKLKWTKTIIGVVKDIVMSSPYDPVQPTFYNYRRSSLSQWHIRINPAVSAATAIPKINAALTKIAPAALLNYQFVDEEYAVKFGEEQRIGKLATVFSTLAIFISCLGLFGLASFVAEQRTKEIGIRKVLGASVSNLWRMLSKDFVVLVIISCIVAAPLTYYFMEGWLEKYQYRTTLSWWIFAAAIGGTLLITLLTVSFQAIKAAVANPVESLRAE
jgi:ABC-type antimicrobial peptide transport system permease subunit